MLKNNRCLSLIFLILLLGYFVFNGFCDEVRSTDREANIQQLNLSIRPTREVFELNTSIFIEVTFENRSNEPILLYDVFNVLQRSLQFDITMPSGGRPHETFTAAGKMLYTNKFKKIPRGKIYRTVMDISDHWYDLNQRGKYVISATYSNNNDSGDGSLIKVWTGSVKSNVATITIK